MSRVDDLRSDYERLGRLLDDLTSDQASAAAAIARERRIIGELLEVLGSGESEEVPLVDRLEDELGKRREAKGGDPRPPSRRRKSG